MKKLTFVLVLCALLASCGANDVNNEPADKSAPEAQQENSQAADNQLQGLDVGGAFIGSATLN